jgi:LysR family transcriptional regulator for metE and metH
MSRDTAPALETRDLRLVTAVADHGGLTRAGAALHLTQSALSHQLADLERRMGTELFARRGRRLVPTPAGERLITSARPILSALSRAEDDVRGVAAAREAVLRMSTECYTCYHWLPAVMREYHRKFPKVETRVVAEVTRRPIPALLRGQLDLAIVSTPVRDRRIDTTPLFRDEMMAIVAPDHPWAAKRWIAAEDFANEHLISYTLSPSESTLQQEVLIPAGVAPRQISQVELTEAIIELVRAGLGVGVLARWAVAPQLDAGTLRAVSITDRGLERQWSAATLRHKSTPLHLRAFVELLGRHLVPRRGAALTMVRS